MTSIIFTWKLFNLLQHTLSSSSLPLFLSSSFLLPPHQPEVQVSADFKLLRYRTRVLRPAHRFSLLRVSKLRCSSDTTITTYHNHLYLVTLSVHQLLLALAGPSLSPNQVSFGRNDANQSTTSRAAIESGIRSGSQLRVSRA